MTRRSGNWVTVTEFCQEFGISRSTWDDWRAKGRAPKCIRLPNGSLRIRRTDFEKWVNLLEDEAA
ncbi:helix-turn-helix domain-containing protein [Saccharopolyspora sp. NPDC050642]|uniref:helix-turn-helix transcriptional regulator n=1 Tax=Saccharopolyspora sp. NPDC050642 TaxID=3157099 RepID=UPI0033FC6F11